MSLIASACLILAIYLYVVGVGVAAMIAFAPEGFQDSDGFHLGELGT